MSLYTEKQVHELKLLNKQIDEKEAKIKELSIIYQDAKSQKASEIIKLKELNDSLREKIRKI